MAHQERKGTREGGKVTCFLVVRLLPVIQDILPCHVPSQPIQSGSLGPVTPKQEAAVSKGNDISWLRLPFAVELHRPSRGCESHPVGSLKKMHLAFWSI